MNYLTVTVKVIILLILGTGFEQNNVCMIVRILSKLTGYCRVVVTKQQPNIYYLLCLIMQKVITLNHPELKVN